MHVFCVFRLRVQLLQAEIRWPKGSACNTGARQLHSKDLIPKELLQGIDG